MLCNLAHQFPPFVASFLEHSRLLRRRFREETVTDLLMGSLITAGGGRVIVEFPNEPVTGADMEWNFANPDDGTFFRILLQAKRCYGRGGVWTRHGYKELLHTAGSRTKFQAVVLCDTARAEIATYPLYIFYHPESTCSAARATGLRTVTGACLADGYVIERLVTGATTRALRTRNKSLKTIAPLLFPLSNLFCPPTVVDKGPFAFVSDRLAFRMATGRQGGRTVIGAPVPPPPSVVRDRIISNLQIMAKGGEEAIIDLPAVPTVAKQIPEEVLDRIERAGSGHASSRELRHWRVTFVSASSRDIDDELARIRLGRE
ncbi:hypothetical protein ADZ37_07210 [Pannonibacter phragmitetus]|uniref:DUF6615 family protein n=1 Tax=Pannonibacter phragmitetus TaxID=121719 RepID=UPI00067C3FAE|nr:DUF6615 family protein [Pannonibacter phragmitetus]KND20192.1 hypothetical protein ADZ37_07210 [Pannonibacter phragmitetus]